MASLNSASTRMAHKVSLSVNPGVTILQTEAVTEIPFSGGSLFS